MRRPVIPGASIENNDDQSDLLICPVAECKRKYETIGGLQRHLRTNHVGIEMVNGRTLRAGESLGHSNSNSKIKIAEISNYKQINLIFNIFF